MNNSKANSLKLKCIFENNLFYAIIQSTISLVFFTIFSLSPSSLWSQSQNLPLNHWAYSFLDRLQTKGLYISEDFDTRPYSREAITEIILQINTKVQSDPALLSHVEWELYEQLKGEFHEELNNLGQNIDIKKKEYETHLFSWRTEDFVIHWDGLLGQQNKFESKREVDSIPKSLSHWGSSFRANIKQSLAIYAEARSFILGDADSLTADVFNPSLGLPVTSKALVDVAVTDNASAYVVFRPPWLDLEFGRDLVEWGPGFRGNLMLSRNSNFYDLVKFTFRYQKFKFQHLHAFLNADSTKYLAGHRLEVRPFKSFYFAFSESVVYGNRSVESLYLNPFIPIIIAERHLGNQDNNMISVDFSLFLNKYNLKLYSEILFDDFSFAKDIFNDFVNKWGVLFGGYWVDPLGAKNTDFRFELIRIQPFVYSHREPVNTYSNYNNVMGHWLGPDSDDWYFEITHQPHKNLRFGISWEQRRRGENDINQGTRPEDGKIHFLDGVVERNRFYAIFGQWQIRRDVFLNVTYNFIQSKNLNREEGLNQNNHRLLLQLSLNY